MRSITTYSVVKEILYVAIFSKHQHGGGNIEKHISNSEYDMHLADCAL